MATESNAACKSLKYIFIYYINNDTIITNIVGKFCYYIMVDVFSSVAFLTLCSPDHLQRDSLHVYMNMIRVVNNKFLFYYD